MSYGDHVSIVFATTNSSIAFSGQQLPHGYGGYCVGSDLGTENRFIGHPSTLLRNQKLDGAGLMYFNAHG